MKTYEFGLKHDDGMVTIRARAENLADAQKIALDIEKAPNKEDTRNNQARVDF